MEVTLFCVFVLRIVVCYQFKPDPKEQKHLEMGIEWQKLPFAGEYFNVQRDLDNKMRNKIRIRHF